MADIIPLTGNGFIAKNITDGDQFSVGGNYVFGNRPDAKIVVDYEALAPVLKKFSALLKKHPPEHFIADVEKWGIQNEQKTIAALYVIQTGIQNWVWEKTTKDTKDRQKLYNGETSLTLSQIMNEGQMACVELALISAEILKEQGYDVKIVSGAFIEQKVSEGDEAYNDPHTFLLVEDPDSETDNVIIFDPAQPIIASFGQVPSCFVLPRDTLIDWSKQARSKPTFLEVTQEISGQTKYYGAAPPMTVFWPEHHVFRAQEKLHEEPDVKVG